MLDKSSKLIYEAQKLIWPKRNSDIAVHSILPGRNRKQFDGNMQYAQYMIDIYLTATNTKDGKMSILLAGFDMDKNNKFAYDLSLGVDDSRTPSIHRRLSAIRNPTLVEESIDLLDVYTDSLWSENVVIDTSNLISDDKLWFSVTPWEYERYLSEYAELEFPTKKISDIKIVTFDNGNKEAVIYFEDNTEEFVPFVIFKDPSVIREISDSAKINMNLTYYIVEKLGTAGPDMKFDKLKEFLSKVLVEIENGNVSTVPETTSADEIRRLLSLDNGAYELNVIYRSANDYNTNVMYCIPYNEKMKVRTNLPIIRKVNLGRVVCGIEYGYKSAINIVNKNKIPPLKPVWSKFFMES